MSARRLGATWAAGTVIALLAGCGGSSSDDSGSHDSAPGSCAASVTVHAPDAGVPAGTGYDARTGAYVSSCMNTHVHSQLYSKKFAQDFEVSTAVQLHSQLESLHSIAGYAALLEEANELIAPDGTDTLRVELIYFGSIVQSASAQAGSLCVELPTMSFPEYLDECGNGLVRGKWLGGWVLAWMPVGKPEQLHVHSHGLVAPQACSLVAGNRFSLPGALAYLGQIDTAMRDALDAGFDEDPAYGSLLLRELDTLPSVAMACAGVSANMMQLDCYNEVFLQKDELSDPERDFGKAVDSVKWAVAHRDDVSWQDPSAPERANDWLAAVASCKDKLSTAAKACATDLPADATEGLCDACTVPEGCSSSDLGDALFKAFLFD